MVITKSGEKVVTGFDSVAIWHNLAGFEPREVIGLPEPLDYKLIEEEVAELLEAVHKNDLVSIVEELSDLLVVANRMAYCMGLNGDTILEHAMLSNWTKFCKTEQEARDSVTHYDKKFSKGYASFKKLGGKEPLWGVFRASDGKILKSITYTPKDFSALGDNND